MSEDVQLLLAEGEKSETLLMIRSILDYEYTMNPLMLLKSFIQAIILTLEGLPAHYHHDAWHSDFLHDVLDDINV